MQKPMADTFERARLMAEAVRGSRTKLAVNQNGRWGPGHYMAKQLIEKGYVGEVEAITIENVFPLPQPGLHMAMTVHHYDTLLHSASKPGFRVRVMQYGFLRPDAGNHRRPRAALLR